MKTIKTISAAAIGATAAVLMQAQTTQAITTDTLADLVANNGTLTIGDKTFSGFSVTESGLTGFNTADITVTATQVGQNYFLDWIGNMSLAGLNLATADLDLAYTVTASAGTIVAIDQSYNGTSTGGASGLTVAEVVRNPANGNIVAHSDLNSTIINTTFNDVGAILQPGGLTSVNVNKDIGISIAGQGFTTFDLSDVEQSFEQVAVPEPTTIMAGMLLLLPLGVSAARIIRNSRAAI